MLLLFASVLLLSMHHGECVIKATATLYLDGTSTSIGILKFIQRNAQSPVVIACILFPLNSSTTHGFHVHTNGVAEISPNCTAAAGHFNPYNTTHGPRTANISSRHVGDLGNLTTDAVGAVIVYIEDSIIQFYNSTQSIANRTIIVHQMFDDGGFGANDSSLTGNSGARIACGLIKITSNGLNNKPTMSTLFLTMIIAFMMSFY